MSTEIAGFCNFIDTKAEILKFALDRLGHLTLAEVGVWKTKNLDPTHLGS